MSSMNYHELRRLLPQQFPLVMVDAVLEHEKGVRLVGLKNVSANDIFFLGHFPGRAILPGALIIEGMAQCCVLLFQLHYAPLTDDEVAVFGSVNGRFIKVVQPGDQLVFEASAVKMTPFMGLFKVVARVGEEVVARAELSMGKKRAEEL
ncbi:MAG: 3-hydroxyacyl-ACP dehydratase FabZ [Candidatus Krumholzibacteriia bacterium]